MPSDTEKNKATIIEVLTSAFTRRDFSALEAFLAPDYIQHNTYIPPQRAGLKSFIEQLPAGTVYEHGMIIAEGDLVMVHGRYSGATPKPLIAVDIFRFEGGLVTEHWDVLQEEVAASETVAGNTMFEPAPTSHRQES